MLVKALPFRHYVADGKYQSNQLQVESVSMKKSLCAHYLITFSIIGESASHDHSCVLGIHETFHEVIVAFLHCLIAKLVYQILQPPKMC